VDTRVLAGDGPVRFLVEAKAGLGAISIVDEAGKEIR
jgi:hypothetical protein